MKATLICCIIFLMVEVFARPEDEKYTTRFDSMDFDAIINNERLLRNYVDCLTQKDTKGCTKEGEMLKEFLPDALKNKCEKCSEIQKEGAKKMILYLLKNKRDWWNELEAVYDPDLAYRKAYEKELMEEGIKL